MLCVVDGICPSTSASPLDISVENMYGFGAFRWLLIMHQYAEAVYYEGLHAWRSVCEARAQPSTSGSGVICTCSPQVRRSVYGAVTHNCPKGAFLAWRHCCTPRSRLATVCSYFPSSNSGSLVCTLNHWIMFASSAGSFLRCVTKKRSNLT